MLSHRILGLSICQLQDWMTLLQTLVLASIEIFTRSEARRKLPQMPTIVNISSDDIGRRLDNERFRESDSIRSLRIRLCFLKSFVRARMCLLYCTLAFTFVFRFIHALSLAKSTPTATTHFAAS